MKELEKIQQNINGEMPKGTFSVLRVESLNNPELYLTMFKELMLTFLANKDLDAKSDKWNDLLPKQFVEIVNQFEDEDYRKDDLVFPIHSMIDDLQDIDIKKWEWYSSKIYSDGFEVYFEGVFRANFTSLVRFLGIPSTKISTERDGEIYPLRELLRYDIIEYKQLHKG